MGILTIGKMSALYKLIYSFHKITAGVFGDTDKEILKFMWEGKAKIIFKKNKVGELILSEIKIYSKVIVTKRVR